MTLETEKAGKGILIKIETDKKSAVLIEEAGKERILLPLNDSVEQDTYYYDNPSGLVETNEGYMAFYPGTPDNIKLLN